MAAESTDRALRMGEVLRYAADKRDLSPTRDGYRNYFAVTHLTGAALPLLERGINPIGPVRSGRRSRTPAVLIRSSPHRAGSAMTPWQDHFDTDSGRIRYYGDNKATTGPQHAPGNRLLLRLTRSYGSEVRDERAAVPPLLFFRGVARERRTKGFLQFQGVGLIERASLVVQWDARAERTFPNYVYDCVVMDLSRDNEVFEWRWIDSRRDPNTSTEDCLQSAPQAWQDWVKHGSDALSRLRRNVARLRVIKKKDQLPAGDSKEGALLSQVVAYYQTRQVRFEALAELIAERVLRGSGAEYTRGWLTQRSADGGTDFVGRLDVGDGFARTRLVVLGQAKCESPTQPTGGNHVARTVARLRRGWLGVYVTTSFFSDAVQIEIIEDQYPIVLIHGRRVAEELSKILFESNQELSSFLDAVDAEYRNRVVLRRPEEILL